MAGEEVDVRNRFAFPQFAAGSESCFEQRAGPLAAAGRGTVTVGCWADRDGLGMNSEMTRKTDWPADWRTAELGGRVTHACCT